MEPARIEDEPDKIATLTEDPPAVLAERDPSPWIGTRETLSREIGDIQREEMRAVVKTLADVAPRRLTGTKLSHATKLTDAVNIFKRFARTDTRLALAAILPGRGKRGGYGLDIRLL